jgi:hypothetical protein
MSDIKIDAESFYSKITKLYNTWKNPKNVSRLPTLTLARASMILVPSLSSWERSRTNQSGP